MGIQGYRDLLVWQKSLELAVDCYRLTAGFPREETYGLASQIRRAAAAVPANIGEGRGRRSTGDFVRFIDIAYGSLVETETHVILANRLGYVETEAMDIVLGATAEIGRMRNGLRTSLRARTKTQVDAPTRPDESPSPES